MPMTRLNVVKTTKETDMDLDKVVEVMGYAIMISLAFLLIMACVTGTVELVLHLASKLS